MQIKKLISKFFILNFLFFVITGSAIALSDVLNHQNDITIHYLYNHGLINAYSDDTFRPEQDLTRAEFLRSILISSEKNIDNLPVNNSWNPDDPISKKEALKIVINSLINDFPIEGYRFYEIFAQRIGILSDSNLFENTDQNINRSEFSEILYRAYVIKKENLNKFDEKFKVIEVIDGDTIDVERYGEEYRIYLIGLDAPEYHPEYENKNECFGYESATELTNLLEDQFVYIENDTTQQRDNQKDRFLSYVYMEDGTFVNQWLIENGFAQEFTYDDTYLKQEGFKVAEAEAKVDQVGLWAEGVCE